MQSNYKVPSRKKDKNAKFRIISQADVDLSELVLNEEKIQLINEWISAYHTYDLTPDVVNLFVKATRNDFFLDVDELFKTTFPDNLFRNTLALSPDDERLPLYLHACFVIMRSSSQYFHHFPEEVVLQLFTNFIQQDSDDIVYESLTSLYLFAKHGFIKEQTSFDKGFVSFLCDFCKNTNRPIASNIVIKVLTSKSFQLCYDEKTLKHIMKTFEYFSTSFFYLKILFMEFISFQHQQEIINIHIINFFIKHNLCKLVEHSQLIAQNTFDEEIDDNIRSDAERIVYLCTKLINFIASSGPDGDLNKLTPIRYITFYPSLFSHQSQRIVFESLRFVMIAVPGMQQYTDVLLRSEKNYDEIVNVAFNSFYEARMLAGQVIAHLIVHGDTSFLESFVSKIERLNVLMELFIDETDYDKTKIFIDAFIRLMESPVAETAIQIFENEDAMNALHAIENTNRKATVLLSKIDAELKKRTDDEICE